jgi:hypothetical protein
VSVIVGFSNGESWRVGGRGWDEFSELARKVLAEHGLGYLTGEIYPYGTSLDLDPDEIRLPLAGAMLIAARQWHNADLAAGNDGDHRRQLVDLLEIEVATVDRPAFVAFPGESRWQASTAEWDRLAVRTREILAGHDQAELAGKVGLPGVSFQLTPESESLPLAEAMLAAALELSGRDAAAGGDGGHLGQLAELLEHEIAQASRPPCICFSSGEEWGTDLALWRRLADGARAWLDAQGRGPALIGRRGAAFRRMIRGAAVTDTAEALLVSARGLLAEAQVNGDDAGRLAELVSELEAEIAERPRSGFPLDRRSAE